MEERIRVIRSDAVIVISLRSERRKAPWETAFSAQLSLFAQSHAPLPDDVGET
jgi:hypothetical protein